MKNYIQELFTAIDEARANPNDHTGLGDVVRVPTDRYGAALDRQTKRAELWQAIMDYREEKITEDELYMFMQTFDKKLDYYGFIKLMGELGYAI
jgi:hypothetical protein